MVGYAAMATRKRPRASKQDPEGDRLIAVAVAAAGKRRTPAELLTRAEALAEAPWPAAAAPAWERSFREAYANALLARGLARKAAASGTRNAGGATDLVQCRLYLSKVEYAEQKLRAKAVGVSWSTWARRKLAI